MNDYHLLVDLHLQGSRQGPGGDAETRLALKLAGLEGSHQLKIADIGCGTGASTLLLARELEAEVVAVDLLPEFLAELQARAGRQGLAERISTLNNSMESLPFADEEFDLIWSEGAVYNMGFEAGVAAWRRFLKPGGSLVVSEITWLSASRPWELQDHWQGEYPEIALASAKIAILEAAGYTPEAYFVLPPHCWQENYYLPLQNRFADFLARHGESEEAKAVVEAEKGEIALYEKYRDYYGYGFYVARKTGG